MASPAPDYTTASLTKVRVTTLLLLQAAMISQGSYIGLTRLTRLVQSERLVQHAYCQLSIFFINHHRNLDFGGGDHFDIDAFFG